MTFRRMFVMNLTIFHFSKQTISKNSREKQSKLSHKFRKIATIENVTNKRKIINNNRNWFVIVKKSRVC